MHSIPTFSKNKNIHNDAMADLLCTIMVLCRGDNEAGEPCWAYICIKPSMAQYFKEAREKGMIELEDYATIIESGDGDEPPDDIKLRMEREYGMNHSYEAELLDMAKQGIQQIGL